MRRDLSVIEIRSGGVRDRRQPHGGGSKGPAGLSSRDIERSGPGVGRVDGAGAAEWSTGDPIGQKWQGDQPKTDRGRSVGLALNAKHRAGRWLLHKASATRGGARRGAERGGNAGWGEAAARCRGCPGFSVPETGTSSGSSNARSFRGGDTSEGSDTRAETGQHTTNFPHATLPSLTTGGRTGCPDHRPVLHRRCRKSGALRLYRANIDHARVIGEL